MALFHFRPLITNKNRDDDDGVRIETFLRQFTISVISGAVRPAATAAAAEG